ncbi:MAG: DUF5667 domain-containing protein [Patescibacteria group bacterium]|nr:DUF5667 domain-containing protein [Patescibacteria group bacterium]
MRKIFLSVSIIFFLLGGVMVFAQNSNLPDPGILPDSPFYFFKTWKESIQTFFTFGEENKARQFLHLAEVRLAEYQKMIEKEKIEIAQKTLEKYEKQINRALEKANDAKEKDAAKLKEEIGEKIIRHQEVFAEVLEKIPEQAESGIKKAIEASQKRFEDVIDGLMGEQKEKAKKIMEGVQQRIEGRFEALKEKLPEQADKDIDGVEVETQQEESALSEVSTTTRVTTDYDKTSPISKFCIQIVTFATNSEGVCKEFGTPCDVPADWRKVDKCPDAPSSTQPFIKTFIKPILKINTSSPLKATTP